MGEMEEKGEIGEDLRSGSKDKGEKYAVRSVIESKSTSLPFRSPLRWVDGCGAYTTLFFPQIFCYFQCHFFT